MRMWSLLIRDRLKTVRSLQKPYDNNKKRDLEFMVGDKVYLKISTLKGAMKFFKKGKLIPRYMGLYEVVKRIGSISYEL